MAERCLRRKRYQILVKILEERDWLESLDVVCKLKLKFILKNKRENVELILLRTEPEVGSV